MTGHWLDEPPERLYASIEWVDISVGAMPGTNIWKCKLGIIIEAEIWHNHRGFCCAVCEEICDTNFDDESDALDWIREKIAATFRALDGIAELKGNG